MCEITLLALLYSLIVQENEEDEERVTSGVVGALLANENAMQTGFNADTPGNQIAGRSEVEESLLKSEP